MSKLPPEIKATLSHQKEQLIDLIDQAKLLEFMLLESFGENSETISTLDQLTEIAEQARDRRAHPEDVGGEMRKRMR